MNKKYRIKVYYYTYQKADNQMQAIDRARKKGNIPTGHAVDSVSEW